jgi:hypothetical protein
MISKKKIITKLLGGLQPPPPPSPHGATALRSNNAVLSGYITTLKKQAETRRLVERRPFVKS